MLVDGEKFSSFHLLIKLEIAAAALRCPWNQFHFDPWTHQLICNDNGAFCMARCDPANGNLISSTHAHTRFPKDAQDMPAHRQLAANKVTVIICNNDEDETEAGTGTSECRPGRTTQDQAKGPFDFRLKRKSHWSQVRSGESGACMCNLYKLLQRARSPKLEAKANGAS